MCDKVTVTIGIPHQYSGQYHELAAKIKIALNKYDLLPFLSCYNFFHVQTFLENNKLSKEDEDVIKRRLINTFNNLSQKPASKPIK